MEENSLDSLLEIAKNNVGKTDKKVYCNNEQLLALLEKGATPIALNKQQTGESYVSEVKYKDYIFVTVSQKINETLEKYKK